MCKGITAMKYTTFKQCVCISEASAEAFQGAANAVLAQLPEPEIIVDKTKPFTMYIFYNVRRDTPETVLEALEMLDPDGVARCINCPAFIPDEDRRKKRGRCQLRDGEFRHNTPACEFYYLRRRDSNSRIIDEIKQIPYKIE